ncbi:MAG: SPASM domain-containing protein [Deltaproteobacteria bacterium]|nr:SPASM domain-containing protein [Deltaproteobacteria bacterium]
MNPVVDKVLKRFKRAMRASGIPIGKMGERFLSPVVGDLMRSDYTNHAFVEFTTGCNLKCVYCASRQAGYKAMDLDLSRFEDILRDLKAREVSLVSVHGHGETTTVNRWRDYCERLLDEGMRGADLRTIVRNMTMIRDEAFAQGRKPPRFGWSIVVSDKTVFGLSDLAAFGLAQNVRRFTFCNLVEYPSEHDGFFVRPIARLSERETGRLPGLMRRVSETIRRRGAECEIQEPLLDSLKAHFDEGRIADGYAHPTHGLNGIEPGPSYPRGETRTRDCLDPWDVVFIGADGSVRPCCVTQERVGDLYEGPGLGAMLNNSAIKAYRQGLVTGRLKKPCLNCHMRGWTDVETLRFKVRKLKLIRRLRRLM